MKAAKLSIIIGIQIALKSVVVMGADIIIAHTADGLYHRKHKGMVKVAVPVAELNNIPRQKPFKRYICGIGSDAVICCHEVIEIFHSRPGGGFIAAAYVVPAEGRRIVHNAAAGIHAL